MNKEKKKLHTGKKLTEIRIKVQLLEFLNFVESVIIFKRTNGRRPIWDERRNMAKILHISLDGFCALLKNISYDDIRRATELA